MGQKSDIRVLRVREERRDEAPSSAPNRSPPSFGEEQCPQQAKEETSHPSYWPARHLAPAELQHEPILVEQSAPRMKSTWPPAHRSEPANNSSAYSQRVQKLPAPLYTLLNGSRESRPVPARAPSVLHPSYSTRALTLLPSLCFLASSAAKGAAGCETRARKSGSFAGGRRVEVAGRYLGIGRRVGMFVR